MNFLSPSVPDQRPLILSHQSTYHADIIVRDASVSVNITDTLRATKRNTAQSTTVSTQEPSISSQMPSIFSQLSTYLQLHRKNSIYGPTKTTKERLTFIFIIATMTFCGMNSPFLSKVSYQSLPVLVFDNAFNVIWFSWLFTVGCNAICAVAIVFGWEQGEQWKQVKSEWTQFWFNIFVSGTPPQCLSSLCAHLMKHHQMTGTLGVYQDGGKYVSLVFLPASVVTIMKNGTQLMFSALFRKWIEKKTLSNTQTFGICTVVIGLMCVCVASIISDNKTTFMDNVIGILLLISAAFCGSVRNHYEQILCRDMKYNAYFVVGMREIPAFCWLILCGICLFFIEPSTATNFFLFAFSYHHGFIIGFGLFLLTVYAKNITQMKVIELSSALTRNLTMQLMPFGTWIISLLFYYFVDERYGENWNKYSWLQLVGFLIVLGGSFLYMKVPKRRPNILVSIQTGTDELMYTKGSVTSRSYVPFAEEGL